MQYSVLIEAVTDPEFPPGYFYAHIPTLDITTHGFGIEGAQAAARELADIWIAEKRANGQPVPREVNSYVAHIEIADALLGA